MAKNVSPCVAPLFQLYRPAARTNLKRTIHRTSTKKAGPTPMGRLWFTPTSFEYYSLCSTPCESTGSLFSGSKISIDASPAF